MYDKIVNPSDFPCDSCGNENVQGVCEYDEKDNFCVLGSAWRPKYQTDRECTCFEEYLTKYGLQY